MEVAETRPTNYPRFTDPATTRRARFLLKRTLENASERPEYLSLQWATLVLTQRRNGYRHVVDTCSTPSSKNMSPRVDDVKYSGGDGGGVFGMKVRMSLEKFQPRVVQK